MIEMDPFLSTKNEAVGTHLDNCLWACTIFKPDGIPNFVAQPDVHFLSNTSCDTHCSYTPWLRAPNLS